jgi:hypothetical protein
VNGAFAHPDRNVGHPVDVPEKKFTEMSHDAYRPDQAIIIERHQRNIPEQSQI